MPKRTTVSTSGLSTSYGNYRQVAEAVCMDVDSEEFERFLATLPWDNAWNLALPLEKGQHDLGLRRRPRVEGESL